MSDSNEVMQTLSRRFSAPPESEVVAQPKLAPAPPAPAPAPVAPPPVIVQPEVAKPKRQGETMQEKSEREAYQATIYIYSEDKAEVDALHHDLAGMLARTRKQTGIKQRDLQKYETWRAVVHVAFAHMDEVRANVLEQRGL